MMRAKFKCDHVINFSDGSKNATLSVVTDGSEENKNFSEFTPDGSLDIMVTESAPAINFFEPGKEYYLDFSLV